MRKIIYSILALGCFWGADASAQIKIPDSVRTSRPLTELRKCINTLLENAKKENLETDRDHTITVVMHPTREPLIPHAKDVFLCLFFALPRSTEYVQKNSKLPHHVWYAEVDGFVIFCATLAPPHSRDYVTQVGGNGPKRAWYSIYIPCRIGKEISLN